MGCCDGTDDVDSADDHEPQEYELVDLDDVDVDGHDVHALVALEEINVLNVQPTPLYYVIIGRGPMAVVNHRTLLESDWGRARLGNYPVIHVGFPNPWPRYLRHGLGQPNHLLSFPAFRNQPSIGGQERDGGLDSQHFGRQIEAEFETIENADVVEAWVALIEHREEAGTVDARIANEFGGDVVTDAINAIRDEPWADFENEADAPYRLCLYDAEDQTARWIYAAKIDICTGPGRPAVDAPQGGDTDEIRRARTPPWLSVEVWSEQAEWFNRRTMNGVDAIRDEVGWNADERICVTAGGGVGLNAAEKARNNDCALDWFGRSALMPIFNNPRNITFLRNPNSDDACQPGARAAAGINVEDDLIASSNGHRMGRNARLTSVADTDVAVEVRLERYQNPGVIRDWWRNQSALNEAESRWAMSVQYAQQVELVESRLYDRVVIPNGQDTEQPGQPHSFADHLAFQPVEAAGRLVALETEDRRVRVLGAACNNYPEFDQQTWIDRGRPAATAADRMWTYHRSLPVSAVPDGFIICGTNTALANEYFTQENPNRNVNTMTRDQIVAVVGETLAALIFNNRNSNLRNGYRTVAELRAVCNGSQDARLDELAFSYPALQ